MRRVILNGSCLGVLLVLVGLAALTPGRSAWREAPDVVPTCDEWDEQGYLIQTEPCWFEVEGKWIYLEMP